MLSCYEAGYDGFWLHRVLAEAGIINHVIDPVSPQVRARRTKTDRIDAMGKRGPIRKIRPLDGCGRNAVHFEVELYYRAPRKMTR